MTSSDPSGLDELLSLLPLLYRPHPWHGVSLGPDAPDRVTAFIEIVPTDTVKYELDKDTGYLKVDRPHEFSNVYPSLYGFLPRTHCGAEVGALCAERMGRAGVVGDDDPLDVCVLTEKVFSHGDVLLRAVPIGGLRMLDGGEADDKIVAVLEGDAVYGSWTTIGDCPAALLERLQHFFLTYKQAPGARSSQVEIDGVYDRDEAREVIRRSCRDYEARYGRLARLLEARPDP